MDMNEVIVNGVACYDESTVLTQEQWDSFINRMTEKPFTVKPYLGGTFKRAILGPKTAIDLFRLKWNGRLYFRRSSGRRSSQAKIQDHKYFRTLIPR